jgi:hypothetical protein
MLWVGESIPLIVTYETDSVKVNLLCRNFHQDAPDNNADWKLHSRNQIVNVLAE